MSVRLHSGRELTISDYILEVQEMSEKDKAARQLARQQAAADAATKPRNDPPTHNHPNVPRDTPAQASAKDEQPDSAELRAARALMATPKLTTDEQGHNATLFLTDYDISSKTYNGYTVDIGSRDDPGFHPKPAYGYVPYSSSARTPYAFVECDGDTRLIANLQRHLAAREPVNEVSE